MERLGVERVVKGLKVYLSGRALELWTSTSSCNAPARDSLWEDRCVGSGGLLQLAGKARRVNRPVAEKVSNYKLSLLNSLTFTISGRDLGLLDTSQTKGDRPD